MAVQVSVRSAGKVIFVGTTSCMKVGATAETEGEKNGEVAPRSLTATRDYQHLDAHFTIWSDEHLQIMPLMQLPH